MTVTGAHPSRTHADRFRAPLRPIISRRLARVCWWFVPIAVLSLILETLEAAPQETAQSSSIWEGPLQRGNGWNSPQNLPASRAWNPASAPPLPPAWRPATDPRYLAAGIDRSPASTQPNDQQAPVRTAQLPIGSSQLSNGSAPYSSGTQQIPSHPALLEPEADWSESSAEARADHWQDEEAINVIGSPAWIDHRWRNLYAPLWGNESQSLMSNSDSQPGWLYGESVIPGSFSVPGSETNTRWWWDAVGRGFYVNDHRIEFTGQEATFGVEGILRGGLTRETPEWLIHAGAELYLTQPFDDNILVDAADRVAFAPNFDVDVLEISQMALAAERGDVMFTLGKFVTPFGRTYFPVFTNARWETPFIRAEAISFRETGAMVSYSPGLWNLDAAVTNGGESRDTNSSKALVSRVGWSDDRWTFGGSVKYHDGIGSEGQKHYNHHVGVDAAWTCGRWTLTTEVIRDYYGYRRVGFAPNGITWERSLYHRDRSAPGGGQITGWGYYGGLLRKGERWTTWVSYGEFYPEAIGDRIHDTATRRFLIKGVRSLGAGVDWYGALMFENTIENAFAGKDRIGSSLATGFQIGL